MPDISSNEIHSAHAVEKTNKQIERIVAHLIDQARTSGIKESGTISEQGDSVSFLDAYFSPTETAKLSIDTPTGQYEIADSRTDYKNKHNPNGKATVQHTSKKGFIWASSKDDQVFHSYDPTDETAEGFKGFNYVTDKTRRRIAASVLWPVSRKLKQAIDKKQKDEDERYAEL